MISASHQFRRAGNTQRALKLLEDSLAIAPENPELLTALADMQHFLGKDAEATALYRQVVQLKPNSPKVKDYLRPTGRWQSGRPRFLRAV